ncbi:MAG: acyltransferase family protein [Geobacteraceae bacterium]
MKLSNFTQGRDNNFNLIRIVAALFVLVSHSFPLAIGFGAAEPFGESLGLTMGSLAVDIFFITSGFLVTASLMTRQSIIEFIWARALRIFPALLVMVLLTVFGLGVFFTSSSVSSYLADSVNYVYLVKCATLITGVKFKLTGVFDSNPYKFVVNGSLWTMPHELRMYAILALAWVALHVKKWGGLKLFKLAIVTSFVVAGVLVVARHFYLPTESHSARLFFMFFTGSAFYVLKEQITLSRSSFWILMIALISSAITNKHAFFVIYVLTIAYILFYVAYIPSGFIRKYNAMGDYSYGVYIYAFPVQQSVAALVPGVSVLSMLAISASATLLLAALSWHLLEKRALALKGFYVGHTRKIFSYGLTGISAWKP